MKSMSNENKILIAVVLVVTVLVVGFVSFSVNGDSQEDKPKSQERDVNEQNQGDGSDDENDGSELNEKDEGGERDDGVESKLDNEGVTKGDVSGVYTVYSPDILSSSSEDKDNVLFFKAAWCSTCASLDKSIKSDLDRIPEGVQILQVDYDTADDLKRKHGVTIQHTLVQVDKEGNQIKKWTGSPDLDDILNKID